jgi:hypothetical protein
MICLLAAEALTARIYVGCVRRLFSPASQFGNPPEDDHL